MTDPSPPAPPAAPRPANPAWRSPAAVALFILVIVFVLAADLSFKAWSFAHVAGFPFQIDPENPQASVPWHQPRVLIPHVLSLRLTANTGAVFGMLKGGKWVFVPISLIAVVVIARLFARSPRKAWVYHAALALVLGGALGNLHDRIRFNAVRDMLNLFPGVSLPWRLSWPGGNTDIYPWIFNIADSALVVGVVLLVIILSRADGKPPQTEPPARG